MKLSPKAQASINKVIEKFRTSDLSAITKIARIQIAKDDPLIAVTKAIGTIEKILATLFADEMPSVSS